MVGSARVTALPSPQEQRQRCYADRRIAASVLGFLSLTACFVALLYRTCWRNVKQRKFPDNAFTIALMSMVLFHLTMVLGELTSESHLANDTISQRALCQFQAIAMHWSICSLMANAIYVVVALYLLVVRRVSLAVISGSSRLFYGVVFGLPSLTVGACVLVGQGHGPMTNDDFCWILSATDRYIYHLSYMVIGSLVCLFAAPSVLVALWKAYRTVDEPSRARIFRTMMVRLVAIALYVLFLFCVSVLTSGDSDATVSTPYEQATVYTYCMIRTFMVETMGATLAFILTIHRRHLLPLRSRVSACNPAMWRTWKYRFHTTKHQRHGDDGGHGNDCNPLGHSSVAVASSTTMGDRVLLTERSHAEQLFRPPCPRRGRDHVLCPSAAYSGGQTVVSIPPEPGHQRAHAIASRAYTSYVLEHAREQLLVSDATSSQRTLDSMLSHTGSSMLSLTSYMSADTPRRRRSSGRSQDSDVQIVATEL